MSVSLKVVRQGVTEQLNGYLQRDRALQSFLNRNVVEQYRNIQRKRWITVGASELGKQWERLEPGYAKYKLKKFASFEGGGRKMLVATGKLYKSVIGPGEGFRKVVTPKSLIISTSVEYAPYVDEARSFSTYSRDTIKSLHRMIKDFIIKNEIRIFTS